MSAIIKPCPWCDSRKVTWTVPAFHHYGRAECEDCGAKGPSFYVSQRGNHDKTTSEAINSWNARA